MTYVLRKFVYRLSIISRRVPFFSLYTPSTEQLSHCDCLHHTYIFHLYSMYLYAAILYRMLLIYCDLNTQAIMSTQAIVSTETSQQSNMLSYTPRSERALK